MMSEKRILTYLKNQGSEMTKANFSECILDCFGSDGDVCLDCALEEEKFVLFKSEGSGFAIAHPPHCPVQCLQADQIKNINRETLERGVDVGVAVLVVSSDSKLLLTKRASHLRTFPGVWVPPGGHIELGESLIEAGLRELKEETGLSLSASECEPKPIAMWESVYPHRLDLGLPRKHHIVLYYAVKLSKDHKKINKFLRLDPGEVDIAVWFDEHIAMVIASYGILPQELSRSSVSAIKSVSSSSSDGNIRLERFTPAAADVEREWLTAGTCFAIREWCQRFSKL